MDAQPLQIMDWLWQQLYHQQAVASDQYFFQASMEIITSSTQHYPLNALIHYPNIPNNFRTGTQSLQIGEFILDAHNLTSNKIMDWRIYLSLIISSLNPHHFLLSTKARKKQSN
jgi:hypothetical protein